MVLKQRHLEHLQHKILWLNNQSNSYDSLDVYNDNYHYHAEKFGKRQRHQQSLLAWDHELCVVPILTDHGY